MKNIKKLTAFFVLSFLCLIYVNCAGKSSSSAEGGGTTGGLATCSYTAAAKGSRQFGMDILDEAATGGYNGNVAKLKQLKGTYQTLHLTWTAIETTAGSGTTSGTLVDPFSALATFNGYALSDGIKLSLTIRPIDTTGKTVPSDLAALDFNNADVIARFKKVIDFALTKIDRANMINLLIGNEIDDFNPGADANFWVEYAQFLQNIRTYVNTTYPGLPVGFTATAGGYIDGTKTTPDGWNARSVLQTIAGLVDVAGVTYYPLALSPALVMKDPSVVASDFATLVAQVPSGTTIHIQEIGYATSATVNGTETKQAEFFCEVLHAWDTHATRIPRMAALRLNDITRTKAESMAGSYSSTNENFIEYLRTLGVHQQSGATKQAFDMLSTELLKRGF